MCNNKLFLFVWCAFLCMICCHLHAEEQNRNADHEALRNLKDKVVNALNNRDTKLLTSCMSPDFAFTTIDQSILTSPKQIEEFFKKMFDGPTAMLVSIKCQPEAEIMTKFIDENTGYCYGTNKEIYKLKDGREVEMKSRWTAIVTRQNGDWKIAVAHAGVNFLDNPVLSKVTSMGYLWMSYGFIAGVILTIVVMFILKKIRDKVIR